MTLRLLWPVLALLLSACASGPQKLFDAYWEESLELNPINATFVGDERYNDRLPNLLGADFRAQELALAQKYRDAAAALEPEELSEQDRLSVQIFLRDRDDDIAQAQFPEHLQPFNQFYSLHATFAQLGSGSSAQPFKTVEDYDRWRARASRIPVVFDQAIANMREGVKAGVVLPKVLTEKMLPQLDALIVEDPTQSLFYTPIKNLPKDFDADDQARLTAEYTAMIRDELMPAYKRLRNYIRTDYLKKSRQSVGLHKLPNGKAWYAANVRRITTTDLTPDEIHKIGLAEVKRIHGEMRQLMKQVGFKGSLQSFFKFLDTDKRFQYKDEAALLAHYNGMRERVQKGADKLFSVQPKAGFEIRPVEAFRNKSAAGGSYQAPSEDGTRPGIFYVNTYDLPSRKIWDAEDLYLHEAVPGHHFQLALQQEMTDLPKFRRYGRFTAYVEGWALYAESLGKELGVYQDPYAHFGYLQNELWRAIRLVVDTGLHHKDWTRQQVIDYMLANSAQSKTQAVSEAERYMAIPGQALAYKIGELKIKELRARSEKALGDRFDIREFHREVLETGAVPLTILEDKINRWIASQLKK